MWRLIKEYFIFPHLNIDLQYFDLGAENRDQTDDRVVSDAAAAMLQCSVATNS